MTTPQSANIAAAVLQHSFLNATIYTAQPQFTPPPLFLRRTVFLQYCYIYHVVFNAAVPQNPHCRSNADSQENKYGFKTMRIN